MGGEWRWLRRALGPTLLRCDAGVLTPLEAALQPRGVLALFFTPPAGAEDLTARLLHVHERLRELQVVQVALSNADHSPAAAEDAFQRAVKDLPWYALPFCDAPRKARLCRRYRAKAGAPTLVLVEAASGRVVTPSAGERLLADPEGAAFPWRPPDAAALLAEAPLSTRDASAPPRTFQQLGAQVIGLYFSAHWCPPCKAFTPQLVETYNKVRTRGHKFEVIFVSSDRSTESFTAYLSTMPWFAIPWEDEERRRELATLFGVQGIPALVLLDAHGNTITDDGRAEVNEDPDGVNFPWMPKLVNVLTERFTARLHDCPAVILFVEGDDSEIEFAEAVLLPAAEEYNKLNKMEDEEDRLHFFIGCDNDASDLLREFLGLDDAVPLLTAIDIPSGKMCIMEDGAEITEESVCSFMKRLLNGTLDTVDIICNKGEIGISPVKF